MISYKTIQNYANLIFNVTVSVQFCLDVDDFDKLVEAIKSQKYFAGIMTSDVAGFHQDHLHDHDLRIVRHYNSKVNLNSFIMSAAAANITNEIKICLSSADGINDYINKESFEKYQTYIRVRDSFLISVSHVNLGQYFLFGYVQILH